MTQAGPKGMKRLFTVYLFNLFDFWHVKILPVEFNLSSSITYTWFWCSTNSEFLLVLNLAHSIKCFSTHCEAFFLCSFILCHFWLHILHPGNIECPVVLTSGTVSYLCMYVLPKSSHIYHWRISLFLLWKAVVHLCRLS